MTKYNRRQTDRCLLTRIFAQWRPHIDIAAFLAIVGLIIGVARWSVSFVTDTEAYSPQIADLQQQVRPIPAMQQQINDIHEEVHEMWEAQVKHGR